MKELMNANTLTLDLTKVEHLKIYHLDPYIMTPIGVSPSQLRQSQLTRRIETSEQADIHAAYEALRASEPYLNSNRGMDARWGVVFSDAGGEVLLEVYVEPFGVVGEVD